MKAVFRAMHHDCGMVVVVLLFWLVLARCGAVPLRVTVRLPSGESVFWEGTLSYLPPMLVSCTKTDTRGGVVTVRVHSHACVRENMRLWESEMGGEEKRFRERLGVCVRESVKV